MKQLPIELNGMAAVIHNETVLKGFWDNTREMGTLLMLVVSELSEALEADRKGKHVQVTDEVKDITDNLWFEAYIKDTFEDEMADVIIRILDICAVYNIDIEWHIKRKFAYNQHREKMHGKKY
jgi:NTP pyrophosphatase (non-canonical NTP hydrolase)